MTESEEFNYRSKFIIFLKQFDNKIYESEASGLIAEVEVTVRNRRVLLRSRGPPRFVQDHQHACKVEPVHPFSSCQASGSDCQRVPDILSHQMLTKLAIEPGWNNWIALFKLEKRNKACCAGKFSLACWHLLVKLKRGQRHRPLRQALISANDYRYTIFYKRSVLPANNAVIEVFSGQKTIVSHTKTGIFYC